MRIHCAFFILVFCSVDLHSTPASLKQQAAQAYCSSRPLRTIQEDIKQNKLNLELKEALVIPLINIYHKQLYSKFSKILEGHQGAVNSVAINSHNTQALTGSANGDIYLWDLTTGQAIMSININGEVLLLTFNPDGTQAIAVRSTGTVSIMHHIHLEAKTNWDIEIDDKIHSLALNLNGTQIILGLSNSCIAIYDLILRQTIKYIKLFKDSSHNVVSVRFQPHNQSMILAGLSNNTICILDSTDGQIGFINQPYVQNSKNIIKFYNNSYTFLTYAYEPNCLRIIHPNQFKYIQYGPWSSEILDIALSFDGRHILAGLANNTVYLLDTHYYSMTLQELLTILISLTQSKPQSSCTIA